MKTLIFALVISAALIQMAGCQKKESNEEMMNNMMEMCKKDPSMCSKMMTDMMKNNPEMMKNMMSDMIEMCKKDQSMCSMMTGMMMDNSPMMNMMMGKMEENGMMSKENMMDCMKRIEEKSTNK